MRIPLKWGLGVGLLALMALAGGLLPSWQAHAAEAPIGALAK